MHAPKLVHWQTVKRLLWYLRGTLDHGLLMTKSRDMNLQTHADVANLRRILYFDNNLITWASKKDNGLYISLYLLNTIKRK